MSNKTFETALIQSFSIPSNIVHYLVTQKLPNVLEKILKTCKYFYSKYKIIVCERLVTTEPVSLYFYPKRIFLPSEYRFKALIKEALVIREKLTTLSNICTLYIQQLRLLEVAINFNEYDLLTKSKALREVTFIDSMVRDSDGTTVPIETLLEKVPNARIFENFFRLSIDPSQIPNQYTSKTAEKMAALKRVKFNRLYISKIPENFNIHAFCDFLLKNLENNATIRVSFEKGMNGSVKEMFKKGVCSCGGIRGFARILPKESKMAQNLKFRVLIC